MTQIAYFLGQIPAMVWIAIGLGIMAWFLYTIHRVIKFIKRLRNFNPKELIDSMESSINDKIDLVEKIIVPSDKRK